MEGCTYRPEGWRKHCARSRVEVCQQTFTVMRERGSERRALTRERGRERGGGEIKREEEGKRKRGVEISLT